MELQMNWKFLTSKSEKTSLEWPQEIHAGASFFLYFLFISENPCFDHVSYEGVNIM